MVGLAIYNYFDQPEGANKTTSLGIIHLAVLGGTGAIQTRLALLMLIGRSEKSDVGERMNGLQCSVHLAGFVETHPRQKKHKGYNALGEQVVAAIVEE